MLEVQKGYDKTWPCEPLEKTTKQKCEESAT